MPQLNIQGTIIDFPDSSQSPNWAEAVVQFAEAVEAALSSVAGQYDVPPTTMNIDGATYNGTSNNDIKSGAISLAFPGSQVRSAFVRYAVAREATGQPQITETGTLTVLYNDATSSWIISREYIGDAQITFNITGSGQIRFSSVLIGSPASSHIGRITFSAQALPKEV